MSSMAANIRVWVRLQHQSREEAIKLLLPREGSDVSDVLLQVPAALNVSGYRPSELALHLAIITSDGQEAVETVPLSNRMSLESLLLADDNNEVNMVVASKEGSPAPEAPQHRGSNVKGVAAAPVAATRPRNGSVGATGSAATSTTAKVSQLPLGRSRSPAPQIPPPAPKPAVVSGTSARGSSPFRRTVSSTTTTASVTTRSTAVAPPIPTSARATSAQRSSSAPRTASAQRQPLSAPSDSSVVTPAQRTAAPGGVRRASPLNTSRGNVSASASSSPRVVTTVAAKQPPTRHAHPLVPSCATRPTAAAQRKVVAAGPTTSVATPSQQPTAVVAPPSLAVSSGVCGAFKPQWGNVLCAMCKHSRQAHDVKQHQLKQVTRLSSSLESTPTRSSVQRGEHMDPNTYLVATSGLTTSPTPSSSGGGNKSYELNLLDPPVVNNLSLGSPEGLMFDRN
ncbi:Hypothetical protein, putative [Bodo saltans]|uniref:Uncharacterized protein n=1 Tax=Bodo saltans TaxID=75058 RepID=A0A0S4IV43_BODSA|nr:Hypothetical protein, putative [Bodo saltans]|eukprot:CUF05827.1 Hypothetical protein, putative [Bodo saltans]